VVYTLTVPVLLFVPKELIAAADGEPKPQLAGGYCPRGSDTTDYES
jgi:hypothetical protein